MRLGFGLNPVRAADKKRPPGGGLSLGRKRLKRRAAISCCTAAYNEPLGAFNQKYPLDEVGSQAFVQNYPRYETDVS
jgi:hypothetical protein